MSRFEVFLLNLRLGFARLTLERLSESLTRRESVHILGFLARMFRHLE